MYRGFDDPPAPGVDLRRFDFEAARRNDPDNAGTYVVQGTQLMMQIGVQQPERIMTSFDDRTRLRIDSVLYERSP